MPIFWLRVPTFLSYFLLPSIHSFSFDNSEILQIVPHTPSSHYLTCRFCKKYDKLMTIATIKQTLNNNYKKQNC